MSEPVVLISGYSIVPSIQILDGGILSPPVSGINPIFVSRADLEKFVAQLDDSEADIKAQVAQLWAEQHPTAAPNRTARRAKKATAGANGSSA